MMDTGKTEDRQEKEVPANATKRVEELPLAERVKLAESVDVHKDIAAGWLIDGRDTINNWCVCDVLKVEEGAVKVRYDGWGTKYDEVHQLAKQ